MKHIILFSLLMGSCTKEPQNTVTKAPTPPQPPAQVAEATEWSCKQGSPSLVIYDKTEQRMKYCANGTWLPVEQQIAEVETPTEDVEADIPEKMEKEKVQIKKVRDEKGDTYWCRGNRHRGNYKCSLAH